MGLSTAAYLAIGAVGGMLLSGATSKPKAAPATQTAAAPPTPSAQAPKAPDVATIAAGQAGQGQAGGAPGVAQTFLTGPGGIDPSLLQLGKTTLLGG